MDIRHEAIIQISKGLLAKMLDFEGATIHEVYEPDEYFVNGAPYFCVVMEHPDFPGVSIDEAMPVVKIAFQAHYGEDGSLLRVERTDPPKVSN